MSNLVFKPQYLFFAIFLLSNNLFSEVLFSINTEDKFSNLYDYLYSDLDSSYFDNDAEKSIWFLGVSSIVNSYKEVITLVEVLSVNGLLDVRITVNSGNVYMYGGGTMLPENSLLSAEDYHTLHYDYSLEVNPEQPSELPPFYKVTFSNLFFDVYGNGEISPLGLETNFVWVKFLGSEVRFSSRNGASEALERVSNKILTLSQSDTEVMSWISNIASLSTYSYRAVRSNSDRWSMHSFGIALDILPIEYYGPIYWGWTKDYYPNWWLLDQNSLHPVPDKIVKIFESEGFAWGGKWVYWDRMHFEYRPEVLMYANSLLNDPNLK